MTLKTGLIASLLAFAIMGDIYAHEPVKPCATINHEDQIYTVCRVEPKSSEIRLFLQDEAGDVFGSFNAVNTHLDETGVTLLFAMNAGMYHDDRSPVGGYGENSVGLSAINTNKGPSNFHMLPNGVFWIDEASQAFIGTTQNFQKNGKNVRDFTQSGPMLVIDGKLHPKFNAGSESRKIRNGVGKTRGGDIVFVKSDRPVNFYDFASFFKDHLKTDNALYLDGVISRLYAPNLGRHDLGRKMGPIVGVVVPQETSSHAQYIANEAVLVQHGETKVMFDPLPLSGFGVYPETPAEDVAQMMAGTGVYEGMDAVFISHAHTDHFSATAMISYLNANSDVRLVAPQQALEMMQKEADWDETLRARMIILNMEAGDAAGAITIGEVTATAVRIPHAGWPAPKRAAVQNMVYRVTLGEGATVIHMGDADPRRQHFTPHAEHWAAQRTDTAFPPYWFVTSEEGRSILTNDMYVRESIGVHVPIEVPAELKASGQDYFSVLGETREIGKK